MNDDEAQVMVDTEFDQELAKEAIDDAEEDTRITEDKESVMVNGELEIYLSTDGKHTVHLKTHEPNNAIRKQAISKAMELYDFVLARYGTKQAQAVKEYSKENGTSKEKGVEQTTCKHIEVKFAQSHTDKNPDRWFKSCKSCGAFLGWQ